MSSVVGSAKSPLDIYREHLLRGELAYQYDEIAGRAIFYPRVIGPVSGASELVWKVSSGRGTVYASTMVHARGVAPYNVALIDLDEGFRMMSRVEVSDGTPVRIGDRVSMRVALNDEAGPFPVFERVATQSHE